jgi:hypothetical protein
LSHVTHRQPSSVRSVYDISSNPDCTSAQGPRKLDNGYCLWRQSPWRLAPREVRNRLVLSTGPDFAPFDTFVAAMSLAPIFIGGASRSGTTLLRVILDTHPNIACGPEIKVIPVLCDLWHRFQTVYLPALQEHCLSAADIHAVYRQAIVALLTPYCRRAGKQRMAEKSPNNIYVFEHLNYIFPESPLIQVIRDGRDVICSLLTMNWIDLGTGQPAPYTRDVRTAAEFWVASVRSGRAGLQKPAFRNCYREVRYEDMVLSPETTLRELFRFLEEPWDPCVLEFHKQERRLGDESSASQVTRQLYTSAVGRWSQDMKPEHKSVVKEVAGDLLIELGYAADRDW